MHSSVLHESHTVQLLTPGADTSTSRGHRRSPRSSRSAARRRVALTVAGGAIILGLALVTAVLPEGAPARAATTGAGYPGITPLGGYLGNYLAPDGTRVYCIDSALDWPSGATGEGSVVTSLSTSWGDPVDEATVRKLNYALLVWGQTDDPTTAAAVSAYLYAYTSGYARVHGAGYDAGAYFIDGDPAVLAMYNAIWSQAETAFAGTQPVVSVDVELTGRDGVVSVSVAPSDAPATLTLTGATVVGTSASQTDVSDGDRIAVTADATEGEASVTADIAVRLDGGAAPALVLYSTPGQQRTVRGSTAGVVEARAHDSATALIAQASAAPQLAETGRGTDPVLAIGGGTAALVGLATTVSAAHIRRRRS